MAALTLIREAFSKALEVPVQERAALLDTLPPEVRSEVVALLAAHESSGSFLSQADDSFPGDGGRIGAYLLLDKIAQGGMGVVYRARRDDGEFQREVAIKLVAGRLFAPEAERRFIFERRILALLDHPNIVHMIDGGVWQGHRYLVMELISGEPITDYCAKRNLPLKERLGLFQAICSAIHYAHQHLVIHRDLKPSNILVTGDGQVKVLDFGIARLLDDSDLGDSGTTGWNPLTPSCASPEQLRGEPLTLATDIYSLGLLLYEVLTGRNPQAKGTRAEIARRNSAEEIIPPSKLATGVSADMDAIVLKALSDEPSQRYASAGEMSADVARFLEDRPVLARPPSRIYYTLRFCARNKALTAVAAALILAIVVGLGVSSWQARRAEQQRQIAQRRFDEARALTHTVIHEIQPKLAGINGTVTLRKLLIEKTLVYLEALGKDAADSPALLRELIDSYVALAQIVGSAGEASVGDPQRASEILKKGEVLSDVLAHAKPIATDSLRTLGNFYRAASRHAYQYGSRDAAMNYAQQSMAMADQLVAAKPGDTVAEDEVALAAGNLADVSTDEKKIILLRERSLAIWRKALLKAPANADRLRQRMALTYRNMATTLLSQGERQRALESALHARDLDQELLDKQPLSPDAQMNLAFDVGQIGAAYSELKDYRSAAENWGLSVALREKVSLANPDDYRSKERLGFALDALGRVEFLQGDRAAAHRDFRRCVHLYGDLSARGHLVSQSLYEFASGSYYLGTLTAADNRAEACKWFRKSVELFDECYKTEKSGYGEADVVAAAHARAAACSP